jgi:hypothetical protein
MARPRRRPPDSSAHWLRALARAVKRALAGSTLHHVAPRSALAVGEAVSDGWYITLAGLHPGGGTVALFLDRSAGTEGGRRVWYGIWCSDEQRSRDIERCLQQAYGPTVLADLERALTRRQLAYPIREPGGGRYGHYFGFYVPTPPDTRRSPPSSVISQIATFCELVDGALGDATSALVATISDDEGATDRAIDDGDPQKRTRRNILARRGQARFRRALLQWFGGRCCVTGTTAVPILEAAHIEVIPKADRHALANGLLLRSDVHTLFDLGLLAVEPTAHVVHIHPSLQTTEYRRFHGITLKASTLVRQSIDERALLKRWNSARWAKRSKTARRRTSRGSP